MLKDEIGMDPPEEDASTFVKQGLICFTSFFICGGVPLLGYAAAMTATQDPNWLMGISAIITSVMLFLLGALKAQFTIKSWWYSGLEIFVLGALTAGAAYFIGWFVEWIIRQSDPLGFGNSTITHG